MLPRSPVLRNVQSIPTGSRQNLARSLFKQTDRMEGILSGNHASTVLQSVQYGPHCTVKALPHLLSLLNLSRPFILTGHSLLNKTSVISDIQTLLGSKCVGVSSNIGEHAPIAGIEAALLQFSQAQGDSIISIGGGSPIDAAKLMSYLQHQKTGIYIPSIAIPTTLSAAENTFIAGYTNTEGNKAGVSDPELAPKGIIYDAALTIFTPETLWLSSGIRGLDHAIEAQYRPFVSPPIKALALSAISDFFTLLPRCKEDPQNLEIRQGLLSAAWKSLYSFRPEKWVGLGTSHALGYKLGSTYSIPHGICSCITLGGVVTYYETHGTVAQKSGILDARKFVPEEYIVGKGGVGEAIDSLVLKLDLKRSLAQMNVPGRDIEAIVSGATGSKEERVNAPLVEMMKHRL